MHTIMTTWSEDMPWFSSPRPFQFHDSSYLRKLSDKELFLPKKNSYHPSLLKLVNIDYILKRIKEAYKSSCAYCIVLLDVRDWYSHSFSTYFVRGQFWIESAFVSHSNLTFTLLQYIALYEQDCIDMLMAHKAIHNNQAFSSLTSLQSN